MNLLSSTNLSDPSGSGRTTSADTRASSRDASPAGVHSQGKQAGKDTKRDPTVGDFQSHLDAQEAPPPPRLPSAKSAKKSATDNGAPASLVDPVRLAAALAGGATLESLPSSPAVALVTGSQRPPSAETAEALAASPSPADTAGDSNAETLTDTATAPNAASAAPPDVPTTGAQLAAAIPMATPTFDVTALAASASDAPKTPAIPAAGPPTASRGKPGLPARAESAERGDPKTPIASRSSDPRVTEAKDGDALRPATAAAPGAADGSDPDASTMGTKPEPRTDPGATAGLERTSQTTSASKGASAEQASDRAAFERTQASNAASRSGASAPSDATTGSSASRTLAITGAAPTVNTLTPAKAVSVPERTMDSPSASLDATPTASAINQQVIRGAAHGVIELPDLGRVQVSAKSQDGELGVRVTADRPETTTILLPHTAAMAAEVRSPVNSSVRVDVESRNAAFTSHAGTSSGGGRESGRRAATESNDGDEPLEIVPGATRPRVRIVL